MSRRRRFGSILKHQLAAYLDFKRALGFTSFTSPYIAQDFDYYLVFHGVTAVSQIDESLLANWVHAIPLSPGAKNNKLKFARGFCRYLLRLGLMRDNPAARISYLRTRPHKPHIFTLKELQQVLEAARGLGRRYRNLLTGCTIETMIFLIYACGLRLGEALKLRLRDVNFEDRTLSLWNTKFHKERLVPFSPAVGQKLHVYLIRRQELYPNMAPTEPFFRHHTRRSANRPVDPRYHHGVVEKHFRDCLLRGGVIKAGGRDAPRVHDLRHTFAVHRLYKWYQEGYDILNKLPLLSTYMGHSALEHTQVYLTICLALLREGNRRFQAGFGDIADRALKRAFTKS